MKTRILALGLMIAGSAAPQAATYTVEMLGDPNRFLPSDLTVRVGDTVTWINHDPDRPHSTASFNGDWESELLFEDETFSHQFTTVGAFDYFGAYVGMMGMIRVVGGVNIAPSVTLLSPTNGATFPAPGRCVISAAATDPDGSVTNVQFYAGTNYVGNRATSPFSVTASNLAAGLYDLTARAADNLGLIATSAPVQIQVVTPAVLRLSLPILTPQHVRVSFATTPNLTYVLEGTSNLTNGWTGLSTNLASGPLTTVTNPAPRPPRRFYRAYLVR